MFIANGRKIAAGILVAGLLTAGSAQAGQVVFTDFIHDSGSDPAMYKITVDDMAVADKIQVTVEVLNMSGDLLGVFFDANSDSVIGEADIDLASSIPPGADITDFDNDTNALGPNNLNGDLNTGPFDVGLTVGEPGSAGGALTTVVLEIDNQGGTLTADDFTRFGLRAQSTGDDEEGSDKALTTGVIPEPATIALVALGGLALLRRRH